MRKVIIIFGVILGVFVFAKQTLAYDLTLTSVGPLSTLGTSYSLVNYTGPIPTMTGTASPSANVE